MYNDNHNNIENNKNNLFTLDQINGKETSHNINRIESAQKNIEL